VLEPDADLRLLLSDLFAEDDYNTKFASSLANVQELVTSGDADLVVSDSWGPSNVNLGYDESQEIVALGSKVPLILFTGRAWAQYEPPGRLDRVVLLRKPADVDRLRSEVGRLLTRAYAAADSRWA
jgi:DNA-binding NtrC family response regulator